MLRDVASETIKPVYSLHFLLQCVPRDNSGYSGRRTAIQRVYWVIANYHASQRQSGDLGGEGREFFGPPPSCIAPFAELGRLFVHLSFKAGLNGPIQTSWHGTARQVYEKPRIFFDGDGAKALDNITANIKGPGPIALVRQKIINFKSR